MNDLENLPPVGSPADSQAQNGKARYSIVVYDQDEIAAYEVANIDAVLDRVDSEKVNWITIRNVHEEDELIKLLLRFDIDPVFLPDILDEGPVEFDTEYKNCLYLEYVVPYLDADTRLLEPSNGSFILGHNFLIVYEHQSHGVLARTRRRVLNHQTKALQYGADYLLYLLLRGFVVENYQRGFKHLTGKLEALEDDVLASQNDESAYQAILALREEIKPWNEPLLELEDFLEYVKDAESKFITEDVARLFSKALYREIDSLLAYYNRLRLMLKEVMDLHQANIQRNMGRVNQLLTIVATIFLPITFIASIYGMNFLHMPELSWRWGYPAVLLLMAVVAGSLIVFMKRRRWF